MFSYSVIIRSKTDIEIEIADRFCSVEAAKEAVNRFERTIASYGDTIYVYYKKILIYKKRVWSDWECMTSLPNYPYCRIVSYPYEKEMKQYLIDSYKAFLDLLPPEAIKERFDEEEWINSK